MNTGGGKMRVRLDRFDPKDGLQRGRALWVEAGWYLVRRLFFTTCLPWPSALKAMWLRWFGADVGRGVVIKPRTHILFPWKLRVGDHAWLGEEVWILNFEEVCIGAHACVSQRVFLCGGNHDWQSEEMRYRNAPIQIGAGAWVGAGAVVGPGVSVGQEAVVLLGAVVVRDVESGWVVAGNPAVPLKRRWKGDAE